MGNKIGRRRQVVDENYTRPQGLYQHRDVDHKKLRKLILDSKLAPCYPGDEDCALDLEECPICFLYYPSLNRSRCCTKGICTECFLQMKPLHSNRSMQCPFCKTTNYAVEYRGVKTKEEKGMEQVEEQRVIEAQIRMRQQELQDEEERMQERQEINSSSRIMSPAEVENRDISSTSHSVPSLSYPSQGDEVLCSQGLCSVSGSRRPSGLRQNREDNFDMDLEDILVMEAIWLSIQDNETQRNRTIGCSNLPERSSIEDSYNSHAIALAEASPSGGLACAAAALAEHQHMNADSATVASSGSLVYNMLRQSSSSPAGEGWSVGSYPPESCTEVSPGSERAFLREEGEWGMDQGSEVVQARTSYASSDLAVDVGTAPLSLMESVNMAAGHFLPESFEEQMMLAMAVSLAEARARTACSQGLTWL